MLRSYQRLVQLVNKIHQMTSRNTLPFGCIQIILAGDFWQLKCIPSAVDDGVQLYESQLFDKVLRQQQNQIRLKEELDLLRVEICDHENELCSRWRGSCPRNKNPSIFTLSLRRVKYIIYVGDNTWNRTEVARK